jgi:hypothetical protein
MLAKSLLCDRGVGGHEARGAAAGMGGAAAPASLAECCLGVTRSLANHEAAEALVGGSGSIHETLSAKVCETRVTQELRSDMA